MTQEKKKPATPRSVTAEDVDAGGVPMTMDAPELGGVLYYQAPTAGAVIDFSDMPSKTAEQKRKQKHAQFGMVGKALRNEDGSPMFVDDQKAASAARGLPSGLFLRLMREITAGVSGEVDEEDLEGNA